MKSTLSSTLAAVNSITPMLPKIGQFTVHIFDAKCNNVLVCVFSNGDWRFVDRISKEEASKQHRDYYVMKKDVCRFR